MNQQSNTNAPTFAKTSQFVLLVSLLPYWNNILTKALENIFP